VKHKTNNISDRSIIFLSSIVNINIYITIKPYFTFFGCFDATPLLTGIPERSKIVWQFLSHHISGVDH
jgi:hypothetical protein